VSPAFYFHKIKEHYRPSNKKKYDRLLMRLLWRDYFRFMLKKHPNIFFKPGVSTEDGLTTSAAQIEQCIAEERHPSVIREFLGELQTTGNLPYEHREILAAYMLQAWKVNHLAAARFLEDLFLCISPPTLYGH